MTLNAHQKLGLVFFIVLGIGAIGASAVQVRRQINGPFEKDGTFQYRTISELESENEERLKTQDSDGDGISDYDEIHIFRTSPFLEDSDSDGVNDGDEIAQSSDPNCPKGRVCREASVEAGVASGAVVAPTGPDADAATLAVAEVFGDVRALTPESIAERITAMSSADLHAFLERIGIPAADLQRADDAALRSMLQQTMEDISVDVAKAGAENAQ
jgi:hypothetical protein